MSDRLAVLPQYLLPKQSLTAFAGWVASAQWGARTTRIIRWFVGKYGVNMDEAAEPDITRYDHTEYGRMLLWTPSRSEASLYNRLIEDMAADGQLIGPFVAVACAVADLDLKRERSLVYVGELSKDEVGNAIGVRAWLHRALRRKNRPTEGGPAEGGDSAEPEITLDAAQLARVREIVLATCRQAGAAEDRSVLLANGVVGALSSGR